MTVVLAWAPGGFWANLDPQDADALMRRGSVRSFARGQALMHEGQVRDRVLLLREGRVKVYCTTASGKEVVLGVRGSGDLVGELAAIDDDPRSASVLALEPVEALVFSANEFRNFLLEHPAASLVLLRTLSRRLREADGKRIEFAAYTTIGRVARQLLELSERFGEVSGDEIIVELPLSQEELAGWTGMSIESVSRALQTMRSLGWIETGRRKIRILQLDRLRGAVE